MSRFAGRTVLVTGGSSGIGEATARRFVAEGAAVVIAAERPEAVDAAVRRIGGAVGADAAERIHGVTCDVRDPEMCRLAVAQTVDRRGRLDVLVANAGTAREEYYTEIDDASWHDMLAVNLSGAHFVAQAAARVMLRQRNGVILFTASTNGLVGEWKYAHYDATKAALVSLARTLTLDLAPHGIRVNAVCPGYIITPLSQSIDSPEFVRRYVERFIPAGRAGRPEDVAAAFAFLASDDASFVTGTTLVVDGGQLAF